eukprot:scpid22351/ scgid3043/ Neuralized-like protein 4
MASFSFDQTCMGSEIVLSRRRRTAKRRHSRSEFCNAIVLSAESLLDGELFEVRLEEMSPGWGSSVVIGVTGVVEEDGFNGELPPSACELRRKTVLVSGSSVLVDGVVVKENFCPSLDSLEMGAHVGVAVVDENLHLYIDGEDQGVAYMDLLAWRPVRGVVDLHGCCVQASLCDTHAASVLAYNYPLRLCRYPGTDIQIGADRRSASFEPAEAVGSFAFSFANRALRENELFEVEVNFPVLRDIGSQVTLDIVSHLPSDSHPLPAEDAMLFGPSTENRISDTEERLGVIVMDGEVCLLRNGLVRRWEASRAFTRYFPVVLIHNGAARVTLTARAGEPLPTSMRATRGFQPVQARSGAAAAAVAVPVYPAVPVPTPFRPSAGSVPPIRFHARTGRYAYLSPDRCSAHRISPDVEFNYAVVFGDRPLLPGEMFEVRVDAVVTKWTGALGIGVMVQNPDSMIASLPATMGDVTSGTWMLGGNGLSCDGIQCNEEIGASIKTLKVGDRVGVLLTLDNTLRFALNGRDMGASMEGVATRVYPVVDVYGQTSQVTLCDNPRIQAPEEDVSADDAHALHFHEDVTVEDILPLHFDELCGSNVVLASNGLNASRVDAFHEFNNGVCITHRALRLDEYFEITVDYTVSIWSGSLEIGVTTTPPVDMNFPETISDLVGDTWTLSGSGVVHNGVNIFPNYPLNLDRLSQGCTIGMMVHANGHLHFFLDGADCGKAAEVPLGVYGMVDLYGQCTGVSINTNAVAPALSIASPPASTPTLPSGSDADDALSSGSASEDLSDSCDSDAASDDSRGVRTGSYDPIHFPGEAETVRTRAGTTVRALQQHTQAYNVLRDLQIAVRESMQHLATAAGTVSPAAVLSRNLQGRDALVRAEMESAMLSDRTQFNSRPTMIAQATDDSGSELMVAANETVSTSEETQDDGVLLHSLHGSCGRNVSIIDGRHVTRTQGYDHGVVFSAKPLANGELFQVGIGKMNSSWSGNLGIGIVWRVPSDAASITASATGLSPLCCGGVWLLSGSSLYHNGSLHRVNCCAETEWLKEGDIIGVKRSANGRLHFYVNGKEMHGAAVACQAPPEVYAVVDVYGKAQSVHLVSKVDEAASPSTPTAKVGMQLLEDIPSLDSSPCYFHRVHGSNIVLSNRSLVAERERSFNNGLLLSNQPLKNGEKFEVRVEKVCDRWSGSPLVGVTACRPLDLAASVPSNAQSLPGTTWLMSRSSVFVNRVKIRDHCDYLTQGSAPVPTCWNVGDTFGVSRRGDHLYLLHNGEEFGAACPGVNKDCYVVLDLYGPVTKVKLLASGNPDADADDSDRDSVSDTAPTSGSQDEQQQQQQ